MPRPSRGGAHADHAPDAGHLGDHDRHERGREHRVAAAGHVGADGVRPARGGGRARRRGAARPGGLRASRAAPGEARTCACANSMCAAAPRAARPRPPRPRRAPTRNDPGAQPSSRGDFAHGVVAAPLDSAASLGNGPRTSSPAAAGGAPRLASDGAPLAAAPYGALRGRPREPSSRDSPPPRHLRAAGHAVAAASQPPDGRTTASAATASPARRNRRREAAGSGSYSRSSTAYPRATVRAGSRRSDAGPRSSAR